MDTEPGQDRHRERSFSVEDDESGDAKRRRGGAVDAAVEDDGVETFGGGDWVATKFFDFSLDPKTGRVRVAVSEGARRALSGHNRPIAVVSVAGPWRTGKSALLNVLVGGRTPEDLRVKGAGAAVGHTVEHCTEGVYGMTVQRAQSHWVRLGVEEEAKRAASRFGFDPDFDILFMDSEGTGAQNRPLYYFTSLMTMVVLCSGTVLYNSLRAIDEQAITDISAVVSAAQFVTAATKKARAAGSGSGSSDSGGARRAHMPNFVWVLRDSTLSLEDGSETEYLERALSSTRDMDAARVAMRKSFRESFQQRDCVRLAMPHHESSLLAEFCTHPLSFWNAAFQDDVKRLRTVLAYAVQPGRVDMGDGQTTPLTGALLLRLMEFYATSLSTSVVPTPENAWEQIAREQCKDVEDATQRDGAALVSQASGFVSLSDIASEFEVVRRRAVEALGTNAPGAAGRRVRDQILARTRAQENEACAAWIAHHVAEAPRPPDVNAKDMERVIAGNNADDEDAIEAVLGAWVKRLMERVDAFVGTRIPDGSVAAKETMKAFVVSRYMDAVPGVVVRMLERAGSSGGVSAKEEEALRTEVSETRAALDEERTAVQRLTTDLAEARADADTKQERCVALEAEVTQWGERFASIHGDLEALGRTQAECELLRSRLDELKSQTDVEIAAGKASIDGLQTMIITERRDRMRAEETAHSLRDSLMDHQRQLETKRRDADALRVRVEALERDVSRARSDGAATAARLQADVVRMREENESARAEDRLERKRLQDGWVGAQQEVAQARARIEALVTQLRGVESERDQSRAQMNVLRAELGAKSSVETDLRESQQRVAALDATLARVRGEVQALHSAVKEGAERECALAERLRAAEDRAGALNMELARFQPNGGVGVGAGAGGSGGNSSLSAARFA